LITLVPKWKGTGAAVTLEEFISSIESSARICQWEEADKVEITLLKLVGSAKPYYKRCSEIHVEGLNWQTFKMVLRNRYKDVHTDQDHYKKLQTVREAKGEEPQAFADRSKELAGKIISKVVDPVAQRKHNENSERMLLANFVTGFTGNPGTRCGYSNTKIMNQAL